MKLRWLILLLTLAPVAGRAAEPADAASIPAGLQRLNRVASVLMIGAHDDDDDTQLLSFFSEGLLLRTAYLSLARGTGAQNRIGPEQGDAMGLLLTQEAAAARRLQGVEQYYTRAFDFGFSKTLAESLAYWDRPEVVGDIAWMIRSFRPTIVIIRYSGTPRDGHGNHQASAVLARKGLAAAADPSQFTSQLAYVAPWDPPRVFQYSSSDRAGAIPVEIGGNDPYRGRPFAEIASVSRSAFRSQSMGGAGRGGPRKIYLVPLDSKPDRDLPSGLDLTSIFPAGGTQLADSISAILAGYDGAYPARSLPALLKLRPQFTALPGTAGDPGKSRKIDELDELVLQCAGIRLGVSARPNLLAPGDAVAIDAEVTNSLPGPLELTRLTLLAVKKETELIEGPRTIATGASAAIHGAWKVPVDQAASQPSWLAKRDGVLAVIEDQRLVGPASDPPLLQVRFEFNFSGQVVQATRPVLGQSKSPAAAEPPQPLAVLPLATVHPLEPVILFPSDAPRRLRLRVTAHRAGVTGALTLGGLPGGWVSEPRSIPFQLSQAGQVAEFDFAVTPPAAPMDVTVKAVTSIDGRDTSLDQVVVEYPHIERAMFFPAATIRLVRVPVVVAAKRVGYVMGTGDPIPAALRQLGCVVTDLAGADLDRAKLDELDAIILGIRAYTVRAAVQRNRDRLLAFVKGGGTLVMQYTVSPQGPNANLDVPSFGPFPFLIGAGRVTVENAPVTFRIPGHPLLTTPNQITAEDFAGWEQERGLHYAAQWDPRYETPWQTNDPNEAPLPGGLLYARLGEGTFVYTADTWFRQLPAGVPGAYRIFANLLGPGRPR